MLPEKQRPAADGAASGAGIVGLAGATVSRYRKPYLTASAFTARAAILSAHIGPEALAMAAVLTLAVGVGR